ncbi:MAG: PEGA domain-containing protein [Planctomycetes bacterium]|nr:PEGA domain-containing protein [Planctomycetota bacterium]
MSGGVGHADNRGNVWIGILFLGMALLAVSPIALAVRGRGSSAAQRLHGQQATRCTVSSAPAGASVYLDYEFAGVSPAELTLSPGEHLIEARMVGFRDAAELVAGGGVKSRELFLELIPAGLGHIMISSQPAAGRAYLDGVFMGFTPLETEAQAGRHLVEIEKANHNPVQEWITVAAQETATVSYVLQDRVLEFLLAATKSDPDSIAHYMDLGHYYFINDRLDDAAEAYKQALIASYKPGADEQDAQRLEKEIKKHARWHGKDLRSFNEAIAKATEEAAKQFPGSIKALRAKSTELEKRRNLEEAFAIWARGARAAPKNPVIWTEYARLAMQTRKVNEALEGCRKAVEFADGDAEILKRLVQTVHSYYRMFPVEEDRNRFLNFLMAEVLDPLLDKQDLAGNRGAELLYRRAMTREYLGKDDEAIADYHKAIDIQELPLVRYQWREKLAMLLARMGRKDEAIKQYEAALEDTNDRNQKTIIERRLKQLRGE